jgi:hypothetical protein
MFAASSLLKASDLITEAKNGFEWMIYELMVGN